MKDKKWKTLLKLFGLVLFITGIISGAIAGYLLIKGELGGEALSEGIFYASIAFIALAIIPIYEVLSSTNHASYIYGEYAIKGRLDAEDRIQDVLSRKSYRFSIMMVLVSGLLFTISALVERFF